MVFIKFTFAINAIVSGWNLKANFISKLGFLEKFINGKCNFKYPKRTLLIGLSFILFGLVGISFLKVEVNISKFLSLKIQLGKVRSLLIRILRHYEFTYESKWRYG